MEIDKKVIRGDIIYKIDLCLTVQYEGLMKPLNYKDVAMMLCHFCRTLRIIREDGIELAFYTDAN